MALSYEHKISGLLNILNMSNSLVEFDEIVKSEMSIETFCRNINRTLKKLQINKESKQKDKDIANNCMDQLVMKHKIY
jgi:hypothetical protein